MENMHRINQNKQKWRNEPKKHEIIIKRRIIKLLLENSESIFIIDRIAGVTENQRPAHTLYELAHDRNLENPLN